MSSGTPDSVHTTLDRGLHQLAALGGDCVDHANAIGTILWSPPRVVVVGRLKAGKSTLVNLITGLFAPTEGRVGYDGAEGPLAAGIRVRALDLNLDTGTAAGRMVVHVMAALSEYERELLADAVPVGQAGRVRLVETPLAPSPVAFGVIDKVVALPPAFMAAMPTRPEPAAKSSTRLPATSCGWSSR